MSTMKFDAGVNVSARYIVEVDREVLTDDAINHFERYFWEVGGTPEGFAKMVIEQITHFGIDSINFGDLGNIRLYKQDASGEVTPYKYNEELNYNKSIKVYIIDDPEISVCTKVIK